MDFVANFLCVPAVEKFWKSVKIWQSYRQFNGGNFFETQCTPLEVRVWRSSGQGQGHRSKQACLACILFTGDLRSIESRSYYHSLLVAVYWQDLIHLPQLGPWSLTLQIGYKFSNPCQKIYHLGRELIPNPLYVAARLVNETRT